MINLLEPSNQDLILIWYNAVVLADTFPIFQGKPLNPYYIRYVLALMGSVPLDPFDNIEVKRVLPTILFHSTLALDIISDVINH